MVGTAFVSHGSKPAVATESLPGGFVSVSPTVSRSSATDDVATGKFFPPQRGEVRLLGKHGEVVGVSKNSFFAEAGCRGRRQRQEAEAEAGRRGRRQRQEAEAGVVFNSSLIRV